MEKSRINTSLLAVWISAGLLAVSLASCEDAASIAEPAVVTHSLVNEDSILLTSSNPGDGSDACILEAHPDFNYGSDYFCDVDGTSSDRGEMVVRFNPDSVRTLVGGTGATILRAELRLIGGGIGDFFAAAVNPVLWTESAATWGCAQEDSVNNGSTDCATDWSSPRRMSPPVAVGVRPAPSRMTFDVTADVQAMANGAGHDGWFIYSETSGAGGSFSMREEGTHGPELIIEYVTPGFAPEEPDAVPDLDRSTPTHTYDAMSWLLDPERDLQWGFTPGVFEADRAGVIRGRIVERDGMGDPIAGVEVSVLGHPEFGVTRTRVENGTATASGYFELLVNGGDTYTLTFRHPDYLTAQRQVVVPWNGWLALPDVAMVDRAELAGGAPNGNRVIAGPAYAANDDGRGPNRSIRLYVPSGTTVSGTAVTGTSGGSPVTAEPNFTVHLGEFTRAPSSLGDPLAAMPAELPGTTSYTYAAEGEVRLGTSGTGAVIEDPVFNQDVFLYVRSDGFLTGTGFQDGDPVPYGSYDASRGAWSAEENGRFVAVNNDDEDCMPSFSPAEEDDICMDANFPAGTYMRIPVRHFSPLDLNWLLGMFGVLPRHAAEGAGPGASCRINNSIVYCEAQVLGESWDVAGSPYHLMYLSDRHPGRREAYRVRIRPRAVAGETPSTIRTELIVAGRVVDTDSRAGVGVSTSTWVELEWDGTDAYGRRLVGPQRAEVRIGYTYSANYQAIPLGDFGFGQPLGGVEADLGDGDEVTAWRREILTVGAIDDRVSGLGGLGIVEHHFYDPATGTLIMGNGDRRAVDSVAATIDPAPYPTSAFAASSTGITAVTAGPDGTVYFFDQQTSRVRRRGRDDASVSDLPGTLLTYSLVSGLSVGRFTDSTGATLDVLWVSDIGGHRVYRVDLATGARVAVLGSGSAGDTAVSPGSPVEITSASSFPIRSPQDVVAAPDGSVYIGLLLASGGRIVRYRERIGSTGVVSGFVEFVASADLYGAAGPASLALAPDGTLYYTTTTETIRAVQPDGRTIVVGGGTGSGPRDDGAPVNTSQLGAIHSLAINPSGELCFVSRTVPGTLERVRCVRQDVDGPDQVFTVAGVRWVDDEPGAPSFDDPYQVWTEGGCPVNDADPDHCSSTGSPATRTRLAEPTRIAWSPDGRLYIVDAGPKEIRVVAPTLDGSLTDTHVITSEDGAVYYEFTGAGRHTRTVDAVTGVNIHQFVYDTTPGATLGRLEGMYDVEGAFVDVIWDTSPARIRLAVNGLTTAIVLNAVGGYASRVCSANFVGGGSCHTAPASTDAFPFWTLSYHSDTTNYPGLMTRLVGATGGIHDYCYDAAGSGMGCPSAINNSGRLLWDSNAGADVSLLQDNSDPTWREVTIRRSRDPSTLTDAAIDTTYATRSAGTGLLERRVSHAGAITTSSTPADGRSVTVERWDGSVTERHLSPDPRPTHGLDAPYVSHATVSRGLPCPTNSCASGFSCVDGLCRADLDRERLWSGTTLTDRVTVPSPPGAGGGTVTWTRTRGPTGAGDTVILTPPSGSTSRRTIALLDTRGRVTRITSPGVYPICLSYPSSTATRPSVIWRGASTGGGTTCDTASTTLRRRVAFSYDGRRYVDGVTEGLSSPLRDWDITHDARGTVSSLFMASGGGSSTTDSIVPTFDGEGNLSSFRIGSTSYLHTIGWSDRNQPLTYLPPNTTFSGVGGPEVTLTYRDGGSVSTRAYRGGRSEVHTLDDATGFMEAITRSDAVPNDIDVDRDVGGRPTWIGSAGGDLDFTWDGAALRRVESTMIGAIGANGEYSPNVSPTGHLYREGTCMGALCEFFTRTHDVDGLLTVASSWITGATMVYNYSIGSTTTSVTHTATAGAGQITGWLDMSALGELTSNQFIRAGSTVYHESICSRDTLGRVLTRGEIIRSATTGTATEVRQYRYTYDAHGYLSRYERFAPPSGDICQPLNTAYILVNQTWNYNHRGHRTNLAVTNDDQVTTGSRTYNELGQLTARGTRTFVHDVSGHLRSTSLSGNTTYFDYDGLGRLVSIRPSIVDASNPAQRFIYRDQLNPVAWQRSTRNAGACPGGFDTAYFMYGIDQHTPELMFYDECSDGSMGTGDVYRLLRDERGSVRLVVQLTSGNVIQRVDYDAWGYPTRVIPSTALSTMVVQPFGFAGGIWMPEAQLWHFGARDMDPLIGRWTTKDPILFAGGYNLYLYANNDPVNLVDPSGLIVPVILAGAAIGVGVYVLGTLMSGGDITVGGVIGAGVGGAIGAVVPGLWGVAAAGFGGTFLGGVGDRWADGWMAAYDRGEARRAMERDSERLRDAGVYTHDACGVGWGGVPWSTPEGL